ncbi:MAG: GldM family protein [Aureispira sp.]
MSIPKEPRQLMINLMYLVLTAMLALNVSAEIINAFFALDKGNQSAMDVVKSQLDLTERSLDKLLEDESKQKFKPIGAAVDDVRKTSKDLVIYINALRDELIDAAGDNNGQNDDGDYIMSYGMSVPKGKKDKDATTRLLVEEGKGTELEQKIRSTQEQLIQQYETLLTTYGKDFDLKEEEITMKIAALKRNIALRVTDDWKSSEKKSWAEFKFKQMPVAAVLPLLSQIQTNARTTEANLVSDLAKLAGGRTIVMDQFFPIINAEKSYVIKGESFKAQVSLGSYSTQMSPENIKLTVNGKRLNISSDGTADFSQIARETGSKTLTLHSEVTNPLTGEVTKGSSTFKYEVGLRSASVAADMMNVFYIGVDNPITISAAGVPTAQLNVKTKGVKLSGSGAKRIAKVTTPGVASVTLSGGGLSPTEFKFRVKRIPDPKVVIDDRTGGFIKSGRFKVQRGLYPKLENFDFGAKCKIQSYTLFYTKKQGDPVKVDVTGGAFTGRAGQYVQKAKAGDSFIFTDVKARCPGDSRGRRVNGLAFTIR